MELHRTDEGFALYKEKTHQNERFVRFVFKINIQPASELLIGFIEHELHELNE